MRILATLLLAGCAGTWTSGTEKPGASRFAPRLPIIDVRLNGQGPFRFVVDTGASSCVISSQVAARLGLRPEGEAAMRGIGPVRAFRVAIQQLETGGVRAEGIRCFAADVGSEADGLLGVGFLRAYRVTLDYPRAHVTLEPRSE